jgi:hypothetical protein
VPEAAAHAPERIEALLAEARAGARWRAELGLPEPSPDSPTRSNLSLAWFKQSLQAGIPLSDALMTAAGEDHPAKERSTDWSDARCSRCSKNDRPGTQTKPGIPSDARGPGGLADGQKEPARDGPRRPAFVVARASPRRLRGPCLARWLARKPGRSADSCAEMTIARSVPARLAVGRGYLGAFVGPIRTNDRPDRQPPTR